MFELTDVLMGFINHYLFTGFGVFTMAWVFIAVFRKSDMVSEGIDTTGARIIAVAGLIYFVLWIVWVTATMSGGGPEAESLRNRLLGPYGFGIWLHPVAYLVVTQPLWFVKVRQQKLLRLMIGFLLMFSFEKYIIVVTSFHRDFTPDSWGSEHGFEMLSYALLGLAISGTVFTAIAGIFYLITIKLRPSVIRPHD